MKIKTNFIQLLFIGLLFTNCSNIIEYSPYMAGIKLPAKEMNVKAISTLEKKSTDEFKPFSIGLVSDTHTWYDQYEKQVAYLNGREEIDFVAHLGDLTLSGIYREFIWYYNVSSKLTHPLITVIGNHDYLSNGEVVYQEMHGPLNFTMVYNDCLFIFMDDVIWEKNVEDPDFKWLESVLKDSEKYKYRFMLSHIAPWSDQFSIGNQYYFEMLMDKYKVDLSIHGHSHHYKYNKNEEGKTDYLVVPCSKNEEVLLMHIEEEGYSIERVYL